MIDQYILFKSIFNYLYEFNTINFISDAVRLSPQSVAWIWYCVSRDSSAEMEDA